jgi:hypothetical protein
LQQCCTARPFIVVESRNVEQMESLKMHAAFDDVVSITLPEGMRGEIAEAARNRGQIIAEFVRNALTSAINEAGSPDPDDALI